MSAVASTEVQFGQFTVFVVEFVLIVHEVVIPGRCWLHWGIRRLVLGIILDWIRVLDRHWEHSGLRRHD